MALPPRRRCLSVYLVNTYAVPHEGSRPHCPYQISSQIFWRFTLEANPGHRQMCAYVAYTPLRAVFSIAHAAGARPPPHTLCRFCACAPIPPRSPPSVLAPDLPSLTSSSCWALSPIHPCSLSSLPERLTPWPQSRARPSRHPPRYFSWSSHVSFVGPLSPSPGSAARCHPLMRAPSLAWVPPPLWSIITTSYPPHSAIQDVLRGSTLLVTSKSP